MVLLKEYYEIVNESLPSIGILPYICITYKAIQHGSAPAYISDLISISKNSRLRSSSMLLLKHGPRVNTISYGDRVFAVAASSYGITYHSISDHLHPSMSSKTNSKLTYLINVFILLFHLLVRNETFSMIVFCAL